MTQPSDAGLAGRLDAVFDRALAEQRIVGATVLVAGSAIFKGDTVEDYRANIEAIRSAGDAALAPA